MSTPGAFPVAEPGAADPPTSLPAPSVARLRRLLQKYELLLALSRGEPGRTEERRDAMRAIARLFPAALREWEEQPKAELDRRHRLVTEQLLAYESPEAANELTPLSTTEDWLRYGLDLHDCLRAVLQLRGYLIQEAGGRLPRVAPTTAMPAPTAECLTACRQLVRDCEVPWLIVTPELLRAIAEPAFGRLTALAYQAVAERHGSSPAQIKLAIFGVPDPR